MADIITEEIKWTVQEVTSFTVDVLRDKRQNSQALFRSSELMPTDRNGRRLINDFL